MADGPRLLTLDQAAAYMSLEPSRVRRVKVGRVRINGHVRWDRFALDRWLDAGAPPVSPSPANDIQTPAPNVEDPASSLDRFLEHHGHAAGVA